MNRKFTVEEAIELSAIARKHWHYDPLTGEFRNKARPGWKNQPPKSVKRNTLFGVGKRQFFVGSMISLLTLPPDQIVNMRYAPKDGKWEDFRLENMELVNRFGRRQGSKAKARKEPAGIRVNKRGTEWNVRILKDGIIHAAYGLPTIEAAIDKYNAFATWLYGDKANLIQLKVPNDVER